MRMASAGWRMASAEAFGGPLEADQPPNQGVVSRVRGIAVLARQELVQAVLGRRQRPDRQLSEGARETRRADRDQQSRNGLGAALEIVETGTDEVTTG